MKFVTSLTVSSTDMSWILKLWDESKSQLNPFAHILVSPLFASESNWNLLIMKVIKDFKLRRNSEV